MLTNVINSLSNTIQRWESWQHSAIVSNVGGEFFILCKLNHCYNYRLLFSPPAFKWFFSMSFISFICIYFCFIPLKFEDVGAVPRHDSLENSWKQTFDSLTKKEIWKVLKLDFFLNKHNLNNSQLFTEGGNWSRNVESTELNVFATNISALDVSFIRNWISILPLHFLS